MKTSTNITNTIADKKKFKLQIYKGAPVTAILKIKNNKGYLKYYDGGKEIEVDIENYNQTMIRNYITTAEAICKMKYSTLWSY